MSRAGGARPLVVYVTSHGFGHLIRAAAIINRVPADVPVIVRSDPGLAGIWRERLRREVAHEPHVSDCGAVNPPGNSADTDPVATMEQAARVLPDALHRADAEADHLRQLDAGAVLSDIPPMPLVAASRAGIPAFAVGNFTWADIYAPYARSLRGEYPALVRDLRRAYLHATLLFRAQPGMAMSWLRPREDIGLVGTAGRNRRAELLKTLGLSPRDRLVYSYLGRYGQQDLDWDRMGHMLTHRIHFVGFHPPTPDCPTPKNLHIVDAMKWSGADLSASCQVIVAKAGYGTVCEAMLAGTPLIFPPRSHFAEHRALARGLSEWGGGLSAPRSAFDQLRIEPLIRRALEMKPGPPPLAPDGAARIADHLTRACRALRDKFA